MKRRPPGTPSDTDLPRQGFLEAIGEMLLGRRRLLDCLQVEVSTRCPGRCIYCPHTTMHNQWQSRDMDMDTYRAIWPLMRRSGRVHLQGWGEPFLNTRFFDMAALARRAGCDVSTTTCGLLMDEDMALRIVESGLDIVAFSLAGTDPESNASRQGVDFRHVCQAVSTLQGVRRSKMGVHLEIHFAYLMLASGMEAVLGLPSLMKALGVHAAVVSTLDFIPSQELEAEGFSPHDTEKLARASKILRQAEAEARDLGLGFHWSLPSPDAPGNSCRENIQCSLYVGVDGSLSPCVYVNLPGRGHDPGRRVFGNVGDQNPLEIWESEGFQRFRENLAAGTPDLPCQTCPKRFETRA